MEARGIKISLKPEYLHLTGNYWDWMNYESAKRNIEEENIVLVDSKSHSEHFERYLLRFDYDISHIHFAYMEFEEYLSRRDLYVKKMQSVLERALKLLIKKAKEICTSSKYILNPPPLIN